MPYMLAPGARLEVGPGGRMYESMGACSCPSGRTGLGALDKSGNVIGGLKTTALHERAQQAATLASRLPPTTAASASSKFFSGSLGPTILVGAAAGLAGILYLATRKKRRRR